MVDIIIPIYQKKNSPRLQWMHRAIESIFEQTYQDWKLFLIDDCSPHDVAKEIEHYEVDDRVMFSRNSLNLELPSTLNIGHYMGESEHCMWLPDDDWKQPDFLDEMASFLSEGKYDFVNCLEAVYNQHDEFECLQDPCANVECIPKEIQARPGYFGLGHLYTRKIFEKVNGYDPKFFCIEDLDFFYRIHEAGAKIGFLKEPLHNTRRHPWALTYCDPKITKEARERFIASRRKN